MPRTPEVSIGLPVYNGGATLPRALDSLLGQTFRDFELIISDNCSTDTTAAICQDYQRRDARVRYIRQPTNRGAIPNFQFVLDEAVAPYFMWAAADDEWTPDFIETNHFALENQRECVASIGRVQFVSSSGSIVRPSQADGALPGNRRQRLMRFLKDPADNSRFYSLFRREVVAQVRLDGLSFHAFDWSVVSIIVCRGCFHSIDRVQMSRLVAPDDHYHKAVQVDNKDRLTFGLPLLPWTLDLLRHIPFHIFVMAIPSLIHLNLRHLRRLGGSLRVSRAMREGD